jgi:hypothetical protein
MNKVITPICFAVAFLLTGCSSTDQVVFFTTTDIGINADLTTQTTMIGYDRIEGMIGPAYVDTGAVPHTVAIMKSNLAVLDPKISQIYATGLAADRVTDKLDSTTPPPDELADGTRRPMFFGTSSNMGLKIGWSTQAVPDSINFGYKRKEFSVIPLQKHMDGKEDHYPSVFASIVIDQSTGSVTETSTNLQQFFATGKAAVNLASDNEFKKPLKQAAKEATSHAASTWLSDSVYVANCISPSSGTLDADAKKRLNLLADTAAKNINLDPGKVSFLKSINTKADLNDALLGALLTDLPNIQKLVNQNPNICN